MGIEEKYRRFLREQPCRRCGSDQGCDPAHLGHAKGTGLKHSIKRCISLCRKCHQEFDTAREGKGKFLMMQVIIPEEERKAEEWIDDNQ